MLEFLQRTGIGERLEQDAKKVPRRSKLERRCLFSVIYFTWCSSVDATFLIFISLLFFFIQIRWMTGVKEIGGPHQVIKFIKTGIGCFVVFSCI